MQTETTRDERTWAMLAYVLTLVGPILAPLAIYVAQKENSRFVSFHALQSLYLGLSAIALATAAAVLAVLFSFIPLIGQPFGTQLMMGVYVAWVALLIYSIAAGVRAFNGEWFSAPLAGAWAEAQVGPEPTAIAAAEPDVTQEDAA
jgi:hypothetical protein